MNNKKRYHQVRVSKRETDRLREPGDAHPIGTARRTIEQAVVLRNRIDRLHEKWGTRKDSRYPTSLVLHRILAHAEDGELAIVNREGDTRKMLARFTGLPAEGEATVLVAAAATMMARNPVSRMLQRRRNRKVAVGPNQGGAG